MVGRVSRRRSSVEGVWPIEEWGGKIVSLYVFGLFFNWGFSGSGVFFEVGDRVFRKLKV